MTTYHIPAKTLVARQRRHGGAEWESFMTTRAVTYTDKDIQLNTPNYLGFWIPDMNYWLIRAHRQDVEVT